MTSLTLIRRIAARPSVVWEFLVTPEGLRQWIGPDAGPVLLAEAEPVVGGSFRLRFRMLDGTEHESRGEYLVVAPPHRLLMTWRWQGNEGAGESQLEFALRPLPEGTELTLTHALLADEATRDGHRQGWTGSLDKLEAACKSTAPPDDDGACDEGED